MTFPDLQALCERPGLPARERALCLAFVALVRNEPDLLGACADLALERGAGPADLRGLCLCAIPYAGFPLALSAFRALGARRLPRGKGEGRSEPATLTEGERAFGEVYGEATPRVLADMADLDPALPDLVLRLAYGEILGRCGLPLRTRELLGVAALRSLRLLPQMLSHARGAFLAGASVEEIEEAARTPELCFDIPIDQGFQETLRAFLSKVP